MKPIKFLGQNASFGEGQDQYPTLPAFSANGWVTTCWQLSDAEVANAVKNRYFEVTVLTFNRVAQPISINASRPVMPIHPHTKLMANPLTFANNTATYRGVLTPLALEELAKNKMLWISTATYGAALQPIQG